MLHVTHDVTTGQTVEVVDDPAIAPIIAAAAEAAAEQAARLDDLAVRVARIESHLWPAPDDPTTPDDPTVADWAALGGIWPDGGLLREGGTIWRNVSGVPLTTPPSGFPGVPGQWGHLFVVALEQVAEGYPAWVKPTGGHDAYNTGDRVSFEGTNYESLVDGNTWSPTDYPAGWRDLGPSN